MSAIQLHNDLAGSVTCVSNLFIDDLMPKANGEFVKVYLYLLRSLSAPAKDCSVSAIADKLEHTEKDIQRALNYWERMNLLKLERDVNGALCGIHFLDPRLAVSEHTPAPPQQNTAEPAPPQEALHSFAGESPAGTLPSPEDKTNPAFVPTVSRKATSVPKAYSPDEIKQFQQDANVSELFFIIETYLKRPLNHTETTTVLYWYDGLRFPPDLIIHLVEYCITKGHSSMHYMDKVAMEWKDAGICTVAQAKENAAIHSHAYYRVMKAFGITGRNLVDSETTLIQKWTKEYGFELPIILEACRRTMTATHQPSFEYADSILTNWHNSNVHTMEDIQILDKNYSRSKKSSGPAASKEAPKRNTFINFNQREYDYDKLEKILLTTNV